MKLRSILSLALLALLPFAGAGAARADGALQTFAVQDGTGRHTTYYWDFSGTGVGPQIPGVALLDSQGNALTFSGGAMNVNGSFSATLGGFAPGGAYATLTATGSSVSHALPAGTTVAFQNLGSAAVSCNLGVGSAAATADQNIVPAGAVVYLTVGSNTYAACIDETGSSSNKVAMSGGSGLGTALSAGSTGGGGGGAATIADGADVVAGTTTDAKSSATDATSITAHQVLKEISYLLQNPLSVTGTFWQTTQPVSGTFWQTTQPISGSVTANLGTLNGAATAAKQPALGTAGTPSADVLSVQGVASMTPLKVDGSATTQPVSGTFWQSTQPVSGTFWQTTQPVSGSVTATQATGSNLHMVCDSGCTSTGGTSSNFGSAFPTPGTAIGVKNGSNMVNLTADSSSNLNVDLATPLPAGSNTIGGVKVTDGTNTAAVKAASTAPATTDPAVVVAISPNSAGIITGASSGWSTKETDALTNTAVAIKAAAGQLGMLLCYNPNATVAYVQIWNVAAASVTVGTTAHQNSFPIPATSNGGFSLSLTGINFSTAISYAATTGAANGTAPGTALTCNAEYE